MPPGTVAIGRSRPRLPSEDQKPAGEGEGEELGVVELEIRCADCVAEIPGIVPVGESQADAPLAEDGAGDAIVEGRQIERLLGAERMAGGDDRGWIDILNREENVDRPDPVVKELPYPAGAWVSLREPSHGA